MIDVNNFYAMPHPTLISWYRVPVVKIKDEYVVYIEPNFTRIYKNKLPDYIQSKVTLATARAENLIDDSEISWLDIYTYKGEYDSMENIGWQISENLYVIVLPQEELDLLKGESVKSQIAN